MYDRVASFTFNPETPAGQRTIHSARYEESGEFYAPGEFDLFTASGVAPSELGSLADFGSGNDPFAGPRVFAIHRRSNSGVVIEGLGQLANSYITLGLTGTTAGDVATLNLSLGASQRITGPPGAANMFGFLVSDGKLRLDNDGGSLSTSDSLPSTIWRWYVSSESAFNDNLPFAEALPETTPASRETWARVENLGSNVLSLNVTGGDDQREEHITLIVPFDPVLKRADNVIVDNIEYRITSTRELGLRRNLEVEASTTSLT